MEFTKTLPAQEFRYIDTLSAYSEYVAHDKINPQYPIKFETKYIKPKRVNENTTDIIWTDEELVALYLGLKKYGKNFQAIYDNNSIFSKNGKTKADISRKYRRFNDLPVWRDF